MKTLHRRALLPLSRPRFWIYLLGPYLIGIAASPDIDISVRLVLIGVFFTLPANLLVYGFNDIFDYETDKHNEKKRGYEELLDPEGRKALTNILALMGITGILLVLPESVPTAAKWGMTGFYFFGLGYSVPPIRAKTKPFIDAYFNILYIFPAFVSYGLLTGSYPAAGAVLAGACWCAAMHAYSAVPDIRADQKAKISTIATVLGKQKTLIFCSVNYLLAAVFALQWLGILSVVGGAIYLWLMFVSQRVTTREQFFRYYTYFPTINMLLGAGLFFYILLIVNN